MQTIEKILNHILIVDLDNTLIKTDLLDEAILIYLKKNPFKIFYLIFSIFKGRLFLKVYLSKSVSIDPEFLPYNKQVIQTILLARSCGQTVILASASPTCYVEKIAIYLGIFDEWMGSDVQNLKGIAKLNSVKKRHPLASLSYIGDSHADIPIWQDLGHAYVVNGSRSLLFRLRKLGICYETISSIDATKAEVIGKGLRLHQWVKNALVFVPVLLSYHFEMAVWLDVLMGFFAFCFGASSIYILNDLLDIEADRQHLTKCKRPLASGDMNARPATLIFGALLVTTILISSQLSIGFRTCIFLYFLMNMAYSFRIKQMHSLDLIFLASMYTIRVLAGGQAALVEVSPWLLAFATFSFFGLAALKRFIEVSNLSENGMAVGRGYFAEDKGMLSLLGSGSSLLSCLVLALYFNSTNVLKFYANPQLLWLVLPLQLYFLSYIWILAGRKKIVDDPVLFVIKSKISYIVACLVGFILWLAH